MNELIQELAMQANDETGNLFDLNHKELNVFLEKFAELIVQACAKTIEAQDVDPTFKLRMSWAIKTQFGVEQ